MTPDCAVMVDALLEFGAKYEEFGCQVVRRGNKLFTRASGIQPECTVRMMTGAAGAVNTKDWNRNIQILDGARSRLEWREDVFPVWASHWEEIDAG